MYTKTSKRSRADFISIAFRRRNSALGLLAISFAMWGTSATAQTVVRLYTYPQGAYGQVAGVTLQKLIAKNSKSLRIESLPAAGREQYADYADASPEKRKLMILTMLHIEPVLGEKGQIPWAKPVPRMKALMTFSPNSAAAMFTNDPSVKTIYDLAGKKSGFGPARILYLQLAGSTVHRGRPHAKNPAITQRKPQSGLAAARGQGGRRNRRRHHQYASFAARSIGYCKEK